MAKSLSTTFALSKLALRVFLPVLILLPLMAQAGGIVDMTVSKNGPVMVSPGETITYEILVEQILDGHLADGVTVIDQIPTGLTFVKVEGEGVVCSVNNGAVVCNLTRLLTPSAAQDPFFDFLGQVQLFLLTFQVDTDICDRTQTVVNQAIVQSRLKDINPNNNTSNQVVTNIKCNGQPEEPQVEIEKVGPATVQPGGIVTYDIQVRNTGSVPSLDTVVVDQFPNGVLTYLPGQSTAGCNVMREGSEDIVKCLLGTFNPGEVRNFTFAFQVATNAVCDSTVMNAADIQARDGVFAWSKVESIVECSETSDLSHLQLQLHSSGNLWENWGNRGEKWLIGLHNGTQQWFFVTPDYTLYLWNGSPNTNLSGTAVATLDINLHSNILQLIGINTAPPLPDLSHLKLHIHSSGNLWQNWGGLNEKWVLSSAGGSNPWYYITPDGTLYQWSGIPGFPLTGTLVATIATSFYADITSLVTLTNI